MTRPPAQPAGSQPPRRRASPRVVGLLTLPADGGGAPIHLQLFRRIRALVADGSLPPGAKLPSSRALAKGLGISRNSVVLAFSQLEADGWTGSRRGSGAYVAKEPPGVSPRVEPPETGRAQAALRAFEIGVPGLDLFPIETWNRLEARRWRGISPDGLREEAGAGLFALRAAIAGHLSIARQLVVSPDQVIITTGARASMDLAVRALELGGAQALVEDPCYFGWRETLESNGMSVVPTRVDQEGFDVDWASKGAPLARVALVSPACQFPTCAELSQTRRDKLHRWSRTGDRWIIEDDYDSELRHRGRGPEPLAARNDRAVYVNSFNKSLFPALRVGFLVAPAAGLDRFLRFRAAVDAGPSLQNQAVLADFIEGGYFDQHLTRCREAYAERRATLRASIAQTLADHFELDDAPVGSHTLARCLRLTAAEVSARAATVGLSVAPLDRFRYAPDAVSPQVIFGYSCFSPAVIRSAVETLARALSS